MSKLLGQTLATYKGRTYKVVSKKGTNPITEFEVEYADTQEREFLSYNRVRSDAVRLQQNVNKYQVGDIIPSESKYLGQVLINTQGQRFLVYDCFRIHPSTVQMMKVRFLQTGYEATVKVFSITRRRVRDYCMPTIAGVGALGYARQSQDPKTFRLWEQMVLKCYSPKDVDYSRFGAKGITIAERWLRLDRFTEDIKELEGYNEEAYRDGKLILVLKEGQTEYAFDNCHFELIEEYRRGNMYKHRMKKFAAKDPSGKLHIATGIKKFARENGLNESSVCNCLAKRIKSTSGWTFKYIKEEQ